MQNLPKNKVPSSLSFSSRHPRHKPPPRHKNPAKLVSRLLTQHQPPPGYSLVPIALRGGGGSRARSHYHRSAMRVERAHTVNRPTSPLTAAQLSLRPFSPARSQVLLLSRTPFYDASLLCARLSLPRASARVTHTVHAVIGLSVHYSCVRSLPSTLSIMHNARARTANAGSPMLLAWSAAAGRLCSFARRSQRFFCFRVLGFAFACRREGNGRSPGRSWQNDLERFDAERLGFCRLDVPEADFARIAREYLFVRSLLVRG